MNCLFFISTHEISAIRAGKGFQLNMPLARKRQAPSYSGDTWDLDWSGGFLKAPPLITNKSKVESVSPACGNASSLTSHNQNTRVSGKATPTQAGPRSLSSCYTKMRKLEGCQEFDKGENYVKIRSY